MGARLESCGYKKRFATATAARSDRSEQFNQLAGGKRDLT